MAIEKDPPISSRFKSILLEKCPRCRQGKMFTHPKHNLKKFDRMYRNCPVCDLEFEPEPGFYTGAMYVSYAFSVAIFIVIGFFLYFFLNDPDIYVYVITTLLTIIFLFPALFRYSRIIYFYIFGGVNFGPSHYGAPQQDSTGSGNSIRHDKNPN